MDKKSLECDVLVVGGGPAGAVAARAAAQKGAKVILIEKNHIIGRPVRCTGLISPRTLKETDVSSRVIRAKISNLVLHSPLGQTFTFDGSSFKAFVIDRAQFDQELIKKARQAGVQIKTQAQALKLRYPWLTFKHKEKIQRVKAQVFIGADGPFSQVAQWAHLGKPQTVIVGKQVVIPYKPPLRQAVEVFVSQKIAPGFFAWVVPCGQGLARVGLGTNQPQKINLVFRQFLSSFKPNKVLELAAGIIPIGQAKKLITDGVLICGDAAGQAKPTSGGGLYTGTKAAKIAGQVAAQAALAREPSKKALFKYEKIWQKTLGKELDFGMRIFRIRQRLSDKKIEKIFSLLDEPEIRKLVLKFGDIDYPRKLFQAMIKHPRLWKNILSFLPGELEISH